jgi:hypothetical protein
MLPLHLAPQHWLQVSRPSGTVLDFTVCPGQELFLPKLDEATALELSIQKGRIFESELKSAKLRPVFNSFPHVSLKPGLLLRINGMKFVRMESSGARPDSFTAVHLMASPERLFLSVKLADESVAKRLQTTAQFPNIFSVRTNK